MGSNLLSLCRQAADEVRIQRPSAVAGVDDSDSNVFFRYANMIGEMLKRTYDWQFLRKEFIFAATPNQNEQLNSMPTDIERIIPETFYDKANYREIYGPVSFPFWNGLKNSNINTVSNSPDYFMIRQNLINLYPVPTSSSEFSYEYVSENWVLDNLSNPKKRFSSDTDTCLFDDELMISGIVFKFLQSEGQPFSVEYNSYNMILDSVLKKDSPIRGKMAGGDIFGTNNSLLNSPSYAMRGRNRWY